MDVPYLWRKYWVASPTTMPRSPVELKKIKNSTVIANVTVLKTPLHQIAVCTSYKENSQRKRMTKP